MVGSGAGARVKVGRPAAREAREVREAREAHILTRGGGASADGAKAAGEGE